MPWIKSAPVFLLFCGDSYRIRTVCKMHKTTFAHDPLDAFLNTATDTAMVLQNFIIAAEAAGLGCCPISAVRRIYRTGSQILPNARRRLPLSWIVSGVSRGLKRYKCTPANVGILAQK